MCTHMCTRAEPVLREPLIPGSSWVPGSDTAPRFASGISPTVKKTEMDKSPFNSPSPQDSSPRLSSFTQHHRPVIAVHSGECPSRETKAWSQLVSSVGLGQWLASGDTGGPPLPIVACRYRSKPTPIICTAFPHDLHPPPDGLHLLPPHGHSVPTSSQPAGPTERSRLTGL